MNEIQNNENSETENASPFGDPTELNPIEFETSPLSESLEQDLSASDSPPEPTNDVVEPPPETDATRCRDDELRSAMRELLSDFNGKLKYDAQKQELIDRLYKENLAYRDGLVDRCKKLLILTIVEQIDDAEKQIAHFQAAEDSETNYRKLLRSFQDIALGFRDSLLERFDIVSWKSDAGTPFNPKTQRSLRTTPTDDSTLAKTIRQSLRFGYKNENGEILRPEMVDVYVYAPSSPPSESLASPAESIAD